VCGQDQMKAIRPGDDLSRRSVGKITPYKGDPTLTKPRVPVNCCSHTDGGRSKA
jgi:hypothetical protein